MRGGLTIVAGVLTGNVLGVVRVALIAYLLGTHSYADSLAVAHGPAGYPQFGADQQHHLRLRPHADGRAGRGAHRAVSQADARLRLGLCADFR